MKFIFIIIFLAVSVKADKYIKFAHELEKAIEDNGMIFFKQSFNKYAFFSKMVKGQRNEYIIKDVQYVHDAYHKIGTQLGDAYHIESKYSDFSFVKKIADKEHVRLVFRFINRDGDYRYIEFLCSEYTAKVKYFDILDQSYPEGTIFYYKKQFLLHNKDGSPLNKNIVYFDKIKAYKNFDKLNQLMQSGNNDEAWRLYKHLPDFMDYDVNVRVVGLSLKQEYMNEEEYMKELYYFYEDFTYLNPIFAHSIIFEYYLQKENYDRAIKMIDEIDERVGLDAYLHLQRAKVYFLNGNINYCKKHLQLFEKAFPNQVHSQRLKFRYLCKNGEYETALQCLNLIQANGGRVPMLKFDPEYSAFIQSKIYRENQR